MAKKINLLTLDNLYRTTPTLLSIDSIKEYLGLQELKDIELLTINRLCHYLKIDDDYHHIYEDFYLNYQIPQIGKEFDLLKIGSKLIINIELKSQMIDEADILKQLERNYYYLSFIKKQIFCFTYITDDSNDILYYYNPDTKSISKIIDQRSVINLIAEIKDSDEYNIDKLFIPSNYLISPFNTTKEFMLGEYFLTNQQEKIKNEIIKKINLNSSNKIFSISGAAGTGKTLLTYDIAKELDESGKKVIIIHCAQANEGIKILKDEYGLNIITISQYNTFIQADILIFDESQRLNLKQITDIINNNQKFLIFSHDVNQKLNKSNKAEEVVKYIHSVAHTQDYKLTNKVRHNKNLASFIKKFFDLSQINSDPLLKNDYEDISFYYAINIDDAEKYVLHLKILGWEHIYLTTSLYDPEELDKIKFNSKNSAHQVIGQEYDNVIVTIDQNFFYTATSKLSYGASYYYNPLETLFQAVTRTRKKLTFVIINNQEVYKNCIKIVNRI